MAVARGTTKYARRKTPKAAAMRTAADQPDTGYGNDADSFDETTQAQRDALAVMCMARIRESVQAREISGVEDEWREARDLYEGYDERNQPTSLMRMRDKNSGPKKTSSSGAQSSILVNITKPKTKAAVSRTKEMLVPTNESNWDAKPTPVPDFDTILADPQRAMKNVQLGDGTMGPAGAVIEKHKEAMAAATKGEKLWIEDRFTEGKVYAEMRNVIEDAGIVGTGVLKGPFPVCKTTRKFIIDGTTAKLDVKEVITPTSKKVRVEDCYPDPACGDNIHLGSYFNERDFITARELRSLAQDPAYDAAAIADALKEGPQSSAMDRASGTKERKKTGDMVRDASLFTIWYCYGDCDPETLIAMGVKDAKLGNVATPSDPDDGAGGDDPAANDASATPTRKDLTPEQKAALAKVPAIVTMLNGRAIKACVQPLESGEFPFDFFRIEKIDGQPWGRGWPMQMRAAQMIVKSSVRRLLENAGLSAGQQIAIAEGALTPYDGHYEIAGRKLWKFKPTELLDDIRKAMNVFDIPSKQKDIMEIVSFGMDLADRLMNFPMLMQGEQQEGDAPETLGGLKMFENNATSVLRDLAKFFDDDLTVPHVGRYHEWFMTQVPDKPKGDVDIEALGSSVMIQREEGREFLIMLGPVKEDPAYRINPIKYSIELAKANRYDMSLIQYTDDEWKKAPTNPANAKPQEPYQVTVAKIREGVDTQKVQSQHQLTTAELSSADAREVEDRKLRVQELDLKRQELQEQRWIAELTYAAKMGVSLQDVKKELAIAAGQEQSRRQEMLLKLDPENRSHTGI